jgi:hypothetical protein
MQINVTFDTSVAGAPTDFVAAVDYIVNYFDGLFTNPVTVNIDVGYGEIDGQLMSANALGESRSFFDSVAYPRLLAQLANPSSATQQVSYATLPSVSPLSGGTLWMATAEEKALGLRAASDPRIDGSVGFSSTYPFSYAVNSSPAANEFYFVGVVEHEFTEILGRESWLGGGFQGTTSYSFMDLFRFSAAQVRDLAGMPPSGAYFSVNNGWTDADNWNTAPNGDLGDWAKSAGPDAALAFSPPGQINQFTAADLELMNVLGWHLTGTDQRTVIQTDGSTSFTLVGGHYYFLLNGGSGPFLKYGGGAYVAGEFAPWSPFAAVQTAGGYDIAFRTGAGEYTVWTTDSNGNYTGNLIPAVPATSTALDLLELTFGQDLNGDTVVGTTKLLIQTDLGTSLTLVGGQNYFLLDSSSGWGPWLKLGGADVMVGQFGAWSPFGAVQTASGYDVAWKNGAGQYTVWMTDSSGNFLSATGVLSGTDYTLESLETTFNQDLNGDNITGLSKTLIHNDGSTDLTAVANRFFLYDHTSGAGPSLKLGGMDVVTGQFGAWSPFNAVQTASGYDVAWTNGAGQYIVWATGSNGNFTSSLTPVVPGASIALETLEYTFNQDLNGDGTTGVTQQVLQTDLGTSLTLVGSQSYSLLRSGSGPSLKMGGADVMVGQFGAWSPFGAVQTASGYDVAWKNGAGLYVVWATDSNGNFTSGLTPVVPGTSTALEGLERTFNQDLNGDHVIGIPSSAASASAGSVVMTIASAGTLTVSVNALSGTETLGTIAALDSLTNSGTISGSGALTNGAPVPNLALLAQYGATSFVGSSSVHDGAPVTQQPPNSPPLLTSPHM